MALSKVRERCTAVVILTELVKVKEINSLCEILDTPLLLLVVVVVIILVLGTPTFSARWKNKAQKDDEPGRGWTGVSRSLCSRATLMHSLQT